MAGWSALRKWAFTCVYCDPNSVMRQVWVTVQTFLLADCYSVKRPDTFCPTLLLTHPLQSKGSTGLNSEKAWPTDIRSTNFAGKMTAKLETVCRMLTPGRGQIYWAKKICQKNIELDWKWWWEQRQAGQIVLSQSSGGRWAAAVVVRSARCALCPSYPHLSLDTWVPGWSGTFKVLVTNQVTLLYEQQGVPSVLLTHTYL